MSVQRCGAWRSRGCSGALESPARAEDELQRLARRHPGTSAAAHAEQALRTLAVPGAGRMP